MRRCASIVAVACVCAVSLTWMAGCAASDSKMDSVAAQIDSLTQLGLPDSVLTDAKIQMAEARGNKKAANMAAAGKHFDSAATLVEEAKVWYTAELEKLGPLVRKVVSEIDEKKAALTGPNLRIADSLMAQADELIKKNWLFQARQKLAKVEKRLPLLLADEKKGAKLRPKVLGRWLEVARPDGAGATSVQKTWFTFKKNGNMTKKETKKGQSTDYMKEDWSFESYGTWAMKGDTVEMAITREKCLKQIFDQYHHKEKKWIHEVKPTYDSTLASPKIEEIPWEDLKGDFTKR